MKKPSKKAKLKLAPQPDAELPIHERVKPPQVEKKVPWIPPEGFPCSDLAYLLDVLTQTYDWYITFAKPYHAFVCALWTVQTYFFRAKEMHGIASVGYLAFVSPDWSCGKSSALKLVAYLCYAGPDSKKRNNLILKPTAPTTFRAISEEIAPGHPIRPTLVFDELDGLAEDNDITNLLNGGYSKGATVPRMVGERADRKKDFETFCPKAFGYIRHQKSIKALKGALESRCIRLFLKKRTLSEQRVANKAFEDDLQKITEPIRKELLKWEMRKCPQDLTPLLKSTNLVMPHLDGREWDVWCNLLAVAALAGKLDEAKETAMEMVCDNRLEMTDHKSPDHTVLLDIKYNMKDMCDEDGFSVDLAAEFLCAMPRRDHGQIMPNGIQKMNRNKVAAILAKYGVRSEHRGAKRRRRIDPKVLEDALERHVLDDGDREEEG